MPATFRLALASLFLLTQLPSLGQALLAGPMLGSNQLREVTVWVQTDAPAEVWLRFWPEGSKQPARESNHVTTATLEAHTAHLTCSLLEPGQTYSYEIVLNGEAQTLAVPTVFTTQSLWMHREEPPEWKMALGSCVYLNEAAYDRPGEPYGQSTQIFKSILENKPEVMLWLGDNVYFREADVHSWSGMLHRYTHMRQNEDIKPLLASTHNIAIWDDHDFGPNDSNSSWIHKDRAKQAFELFWANESYGTSELPGITSQMHYNDVEFFLLDNRWDRTPANMASVPSQVLGEDQVDWLIQALKTSTATFKLVAVGGQFLSNFARYENMALYAEERARILERIASNKIEGVVFLTGDRHSTELTRVELATGVVVHDLTCSPLTSKAYDHTAEQNTLRVPGSSIGTQNYGMLTFTGPLSERRMLITIHDALGNELWSYGLYADGSAPLGLQNSRSQQEPANGAKPAGKLQMPTKKQKGK